MPDRQVTPNRPVLIDLFSCAGGAGMGYHRAGFEVVGVDHDGLVFDPLTHPFTPEPVVQAYTFTHWAPCPTNGEPILMRVTA